MNDKNAPPDNFRRNLICRGVFGVGVLAGLYAVSRHNYLVFHTLAEFFSIAVAWSLFLIFWNTRGMIENKPLILLGIGYLFIGAIDLVHTLSYKGMGVLGPETGANPATQLWIFARYTESLTLCAFASMKMKAVNAGRVILFFGAVMTLGLLSIFYWKSFPVCYIDGVGLTRFKVFSEYLICAILAFALLLLKRNRAAVDETVYRNMVAAIVLTVCAELAFTFYVSVYGISNLFGHYFKILSFYFVYRALIWSGLSHPYATLFRKIEEEKAALKISEREHRAILETAIDGFLLADADGRIRQVNDSYCRMSGYPEEELLGMAISDVEAVATSADIAARMKKAARENGDRFETRHRRKDGTRFDVEVSIQHQPMSGAFVAFIRDISDRKKDAAELYRAKDLLGRISAVQSSFIATGSVQATFDALLASLVSLTDSAFGFLDEVLTDGDGSTYKLSLSISNIAWDEKSEKLYEGLRAKRLEFRNLQNLAGLPALTGALLISNDAETDPRAGGLPEGHPHIQTFMGMPLYFADRLIGVAGVANRPDGYDEEMARFLEPFLSACASIIHACRQQTKEEAMVSALRDSEEFLETVVENIPDMIFVKDAKDLRFVRFNRAGEQLLGYDRKEMIGKNDYDFFRKEEADFFTGKDRDVLAQGVLIDIAEEAIHTRKMGRRVLHTKKIPLLDDTGDPKYLLGISEDITDQKRTADALREYNQRMQMVFDSQLDAIFVLDAETPPHIITCNRAVESVFGYGTEEMRGKTTECLHVDTDHLAAFQGVLARALRKDGYLKNCEFEMKRKDGSTFPSSHTVMEMTGEAGNRTGWVSVVGDLTERKRAEAQLQQARKMESVGNLAGGIAHDFNNILFPIVGMAEMLLEDLPAESIEYENAREILKAGRRGSELVKQILALSRQSEHKLMPVRIQKVMEEVLQLMRSTIPANIVIHRHIQRDCGLVNADPTEIHQIVMNLITNAYHAVADTNGEISVSLHETVRGDGDLPAGRFAEITVSDNGSGIEPDILDKIFDPYFTTKAQGKGTGLGLAVVHGIVQEYGGDIRVDSRVGVGTTFRIHFPLIADRGAQPSTETVETLPTGGERILLVDDEAPVIHFEKQMLERLGYHVTAVTSSLEALQTFTAAPFNFDLVVSDMAMPNMTGARLAEALFAVRPEVPVILCTGFSEKIDARKAESIGVKGFLMKPVARSEMAKSVRQVLDEATPSARRGSER